MPECPQHFGCLPERCETCPDAPASTPTPDEPIAGHAPCSQFHRNCVCRECTTYVTLRTGRAEGEKAERERWTKAAREHAGTWLKFATPDANVIASDYLMWAARMQPVDADGMRAFSLTALNPMDTTEGASDAG